MSTAVVIERPDTEQATADGQALVVAARAITVASRDEDAAAKTFLSRVARLALEIKARFEPAKAAAHKAHKELCALESSLLAPCEEARSIVSAKALEFARIERQRAEAERLRLEAEARRIEEERRRQELAAIEAERKADEERRIAEALAAERAGEMARANAILARAEAENLRAEATKAEIAAEPITVPAVRVEEQTAAVEGVHSRTSWRAEVVDLGALIRFVAANLEWQHLLAPSMSALNNLARAQRGMLQLPGVRAVAEESLAVRSRSAR